MLLSFPKSTDTVATTPAPALMIKTSNLTHKYDQLKKSCKKKCSFYSGMVLLVGIGVPHHLCFFLGGLTMPFRRGFTKDFIQT